jgi:hypothetical protein
MGVGRPTIVHLFEGEYDYIPGEFESRYCFDAYNSYGSGGWLEDLFHWIIDPPFAVEIIASVFIEPVDWFYTARDLARGEWSALIGIVPFVPGGAGKKVTKWIAQSLKKIGLERLVRRLSRAEAEELLEEVEDGISTIVVQIRESAPETAKEVADDVGRIIQEEVDQARRVLGEGTEEIVEEITGEVVEQALRNAPQDIDDILREVEGRAGEILAEAKKLGGQRHSLYTQFAGRSEVFIRNRISEFEVQISWHRTLLTDEAVRLEYVPDWLASNPEHNLARIEGWKKEIQNFAEQKPFLREFFVSKEYNPRANFSKREDQ